MDNLAVSFPKGSEVSQGVTAQSGQSGQGQKQVIR